MGGSPETHRQLLPEQKRLLKMLRRTLHHSAQLARRIGVLAVLVLTLVVASHAQDEHQSPQPGVTIRVIEESTEVDTGGDEVISAFAGKRFHELR